MNNKNFSFININGINTRFYTVNQGKEHLLLVSGGQFGFGEMSLYDWSINIPGLSSYFNVYALDKIGQGYTDHPLRDEDHVFETVCEHLEGFVKALKLSNLHLVGHSRGALAVAWLALQHPELVKTVTIVDSSTLTPISALEFIAFYTELAKRIPPGPPTPETVRIEPEANSYAFEHITENFIAQKMKILKLKKTQDSKKKLEIINSYFLPSVDRVRDEVLKRIDTSGIPVPTQVIWGFNDPSSYLSMGLQLFERICQKTPHAQLHVINNAGHYCFREQPDVFNNLIRAFCL